MTIVDLEGKIDRKYVVGLYYSNKPRNAKAAERWPSSPEENLERLANAGFVMDRMIPKCSNCNRESSRPILDGRRLTGVQSSATSPNSAKRSVSCAKSVSKSSASTATKPVTAFATVPRNARTALPAATASASWDMPQLSSE